MKQLNAMNKRVTYLTYWILPVVNYKARFLQLELPPILFYQELKELLLLFNIISNNVDFAQYYEMENSTRRGTRFKLSSLRCEDLGDNFWYRACYRANQIMEFLNPDVQISFRAQIFQIMWNTFINTMNRKNARFVLFVTANLAEVQDIINYSIGHTCSNANKTRTPQVGAISKAQKAQNIFFWKKT